MDNFDLSSISPKGNEQELQEFLMIEKQKAQFNAQIHEFNDICWEKCMDKPGNKLDSKTETCLINCVDRFLDIHIDMKLHVLKTIIVVTFVMVIYIIYSIATMSTKT